MLVPNVHVVNSPEGVIPSLVGFYGIQNEGLNRRSDLLLFQSTIKGMIFKFLPRIADWEACPLGRESITLQDDLVVHEIQRTAEIMQNISDDESGLIDIKRSVKLKPEIVCSRLSVFIDMNRVEVLIKKGSQEGIEIVDVLQGPLNLFV
jgi:hypothetical protein